MELTKTKFKETEIGVLPFDWEIKSIGEVCQIFGRIGFRGYTKKDIVESNKGVITLSPSNIKGSTMDFTKCTYISWYKYEESPEIKIFNDDILLVKTGSTYGKTAIVKGLHRKATINPQIVVLKNIKINNDLLGYLMNDKIVQNQISSTIVGGAIPTLSQKEVAGFQVPLPPTLEEQRAIAQVLSDTDNLIQAIKQKLTKKRAIKQGAMQQLLTPNENWERVRLDSVIEVSRGGSPRPIQDYMTTSPNGVNWIKIGDTGRTSKYITSTKEKIIPEGVFNSRKVKVGDFLLSNSMSFGRPYILKIDGCIHDGWLVLQNYQGSFDREFLYYTLMSKDIYNQYLMKAAGSGVLNLNKELVKAVELNKPKSLSEQTRIATILSDMDAEITQLEQKLSKYKMLKQGLMQNLLTGKIRLV